jgi:hypothetical protein
MRYRSTLATGIVLFVPILAFAAGESASAPATAPATRPAMKFPETGGWSPEGRECCNDMRNVAQAAQAYAGHHQDQLPPDLGQTLRRLDRWAQMTQQDNRHATPQEKAAMYLCPVDRKRAKLPETPTPEWVNANTSYVYLGSNAKLSAIPQAKWGSTIIVHDNLDGRHSEMGDVVIVVMLDAHGETMTKAEAQAAIAESMRTLAAAQPDAR